MIRLAIICVSLLCLTGCQNEFTEIANDPLKGQIDGEEWVFGSGRVRSDPFFVRGITGIMFEDILTDPCTRVNTIEPHISLAVPFERGNFNLPFAIPNYHVVFSLDGVTEFTANTGFIEIVAVTPTEVVGYLSASFDDDNQAQGSFSLRLCD